MSLIQETQLEPKGDDRGYLIALETLVNVSFEIKRVYYIFGTRADVRRGCHAHHHLTQLAVCVAGSCRFTMDDGLERREHRLDGNAKALLIAPMVWHEMDQFSSDCVLLVLANGPYDRADYIADYDQFLRLARALANPVERLVA